MKKALIAAISCIAAGAMLMTGCSKSSDDNTSSTDNSSDSKTADSGSVKNYTAPEVGEDIVVISVEGYGDIKIKMFDNLLPEACENFETHAKDGYYDGLIFHRVIDDFMIQGGDPLGTGTGGESIWGGSFDGGTSDELVHLTGAVAYANSGSTATDGSQFYIVTGYQAEELTDDVMSSIATSYGIDFSDEEMELYQQYGGSPFLDGSYTVFGQVIDGLDIAYKIAATTEKNSSDKPDEDIVMSSVSVEQYDGSEIKWYKSDYDNID